MSLSDLFKKLVGQDDDYSSGSSSNSGGGFMDFLSGCKDRAKQIIEKDC